MWQIDYVASYYKQKISQFVLNNGYNCELIAILIKHFYIEFNLIESYDV